MCRKKKELTYEELTERAGRLKWLCFGLWSALGLYNLLTGVNKFDYAAVWALLLIFMLVDMHWMKQRDEERKERGEWWGMWAKQKTAYDARLTERNMLIEQLTKERDALLAIVAKDALCETCKHHGTCPLEGGPVEMDCVDCENEDCPCVGCTTKTDRWEWVGVKEEEHAGTD